MDTKPTTRGGTRSGAGRPSSGLVAIVPPVRVTAEVRQELERMAKAQGVGIGEIVRRALGEWLQGQ